MNWRSSCPVACGLGIIGDKWSLRIIRDLTIFGPRTYSDFLQAPEGISTNILANRLKTLSELGLITRTKTDAASRNNAYQFTPQGESIQPIVQAIAEWAQPCAEQANDKILVLQLFGWLPIYYYHVQDFRFDSSIV